MPRTSYVLCLIGLTALAVGCAGSRDADSVGGSEAAVKLSGTCDPAPFPESLKDLERLESCQLKEMFNREEAKEMTVASKLANGPHEGLPLCRKDILPKKKEDLPPGVQTIHGSELLVSLLGVSNRLSNRFARGLWLGKEFSAPSAAPSDAQRALLPQCEAKHGQCGTVLNFIDADASQINENTQKRAEAIHFIDRENKWMALDYTPATTGLDGLFEGVSVKLIAHVYDTARVVNAEKGIYLGMAYLVDMPGKYEPNSPNSVESCYFALQRKR